MIPIVDELPSNSRWIFERFIGQTVTFEQISRDCAMSSTKLLAYLSRLGLSGFVRFTGVDYVFIDELALLGDVEIAVYDNFEALHYVRHGWTIV